MKGKRSRRCDYCGAPSGDARTCPAHRELELLDPQLRQARQPASERELGLHELKHGGDARRE